MKLTFLISALFLFFTGCANTRLTRNQFPDSGPLLSPAPEKHAFFIPDEVEIYRQAEADFRSYTSVIIEAPVLALDPDRHQPKEKYHDRLTGRMRERLAHSLGQDRELVESPGPNTLRVRSAITDLNPQSTWFNIMTFILAVPLDSGGISAEFEITDSETEEVLFAMAAQRAGTPLLILEAFHRYGHAGHGMKKWGNLLHECLSTSEK